MTYVGTPPPTNFCHTTYPLYQETHTYKHELIYKLLVFRRIQIRISKVSTSTSNGKKSPFVISVGGMLGKEDLVVIPHFRLLMAAKMDEPITHVRLWINGQFSIEVARSYSQIICVSRLPSPLRCQDPDWDPGSVLGLAQ